MTSICICPPSSQNCLAPSPLRCSVGVGDSHRLTSASSVCSSNSTGIASSSCSSSGSSACSCCAPPSRSSGQLLSASSTFLQGSSSRSFYRRALFSTTLSSSSSPWGSKRQKFVDGDKRERSGSMVVCGGLGDFLGGDLLGFDLDRWYKDVEEYGSIAIYPPHEGGIEGRYASRLKREGYHFMNITARGLGDPEAYLTKVHGIRPPHLGKEAIECFYHPPELDFRLSCLPKGAKGLVLWVIEAKVLSRTELQFLALLPALRKNVKVIAECGNWRSFRWKPLRVASGLPLTQTDEQARPATSSPKPAALSEEEPTTVITSPVSDNPRRP